MDRLACLPEKEVHSSARTETERYSIPSGCDWFKETKTASLTFRSSPSEFGNELIKFGIRNRREFSGVQNSGSSFSAKHASGRSHIGSRCASRRCLRGPFRTRDGRWRPGFFAHLTPASHLIRAPITGHQTSGERLSSSVCPESRK